MQGWPRPLPLGEDSHLMPALRSAALRHFALGPATAPFLISAATEELRLCSPPLGRGSRRPNSISRRKPEHLGGALVNNGVFVFISHHCAHLTSLTIKNNTSIIHNSIKLVVKGCPRLARLELIRCNKLTAETVTEVLKLPELTALALRAMPCLRSGGLKALTAAVPSIITHLDLSKNVDLPKDDLLALFDAHTQLASVSLENVRLLSPEVVQMLCFRSCNTSLRELRLKGNHRLNSPQLWAAISTCPNLEVLEMAQQGRSESAVGSEEVLSACTRLRSLVLRVRGLSDVHVDLLFHLTNLTSLDFGPPYDGRKVTHRKLRVEKERFVWLLAGPIGRQLTHLALPGITQAEDPDCWYAYTEQDAAANEDIVASVLENCVSLRSLRLRESSFRNHDDAILSAKRPWACRELGKLVVDRGYGLTDVAVERIVEQLNTRLWHLELRGPLPKITDATVLSLARHCGASLEKLVVSGYKKFTFASARVLAGPAFPKLRVLRVDGHSGLADAQSIGFLRDKQSLDKLSCEFYGWFEPILMNPEDNDDGGLVMY